jgi:hypothetical protein
MRLVAPGSVVLVCAKAAKAALLRRYGQCHRDYTACDVRPVIARRKTFGTSSLVRFGGKGEKVG